MVAVIHPLSLVLIKNVYGYPNEFPVKYCKPFFFPYIKKSLHKCILSWQFAMALIADKISILPIFQTGTTLSNTESCVMWSKRTFNCLSSCSRTLKTTSKFVKPSSMLLCKFIVWDLLIVLKSRQWGVISWCQLVSFYLVIMIFNSHNINLVGIHTSMFWCPEKMIATLIKRSQLIRFFINSTPN
jgi:hypothetical protein